MCTYTLGVELTRGVLGSRTYRHLFGAQVVALVGTGLLTVALSLLAYDLAPSHAGVVVANALTIKIAAYVVIAPVISALTEHLPNRRVMVSADVVRALVALSLPFVNEVWQIYVLIFVLQAASSAFTPTFQAVIPAVLPDERDFTRALSYSRLAYDLESLLSPLLAGVLLTVVTYHALFAGTFAGFVVSALLVVTARLPSRPPQAEARSLWRRSTRGIRAFVRVPQLRAILALDMAAASATAMVLVNTIVLTTAEFGRSGQGLAYAFAAFGGGSMVVALAAPRMLERRGDRSVMLTGGALTAAGLITTAALIAWTPGNGWLLLLVLWFGLGVATSLILTPSSRVVNRSVEEADRPAAFAAHFSLSHACYLLTYPVAGWVGSQAGLAWSAVALALIAAAAAAIAWRNWTTMGPATAPRGD